MSSAVPVFDLELDLVRDLPRSEFARQHLAETVA